MIILKFLYIRLQSKFTAWIFWIGVWLSLGLVFALLFDSLSEEALEAEEFITRLPAAITDTFNIGSGYLTEVEKFLSGQFMTVYTLIGTIFALIQGVGVVGGVIEDRTISNYITKNISRLNFYAGKFLINLVFFATSGAAVWGLVYLFFDIFSSQSELSLGYFFAAYFATSTLFIVVSGIGQLLGVILPKNIAQLGGIGFLVFTWFLNSLSSISGYQECIKPTSIFYYLNSTKLRDDFTFDIDRLAVLYVVYLISLVVGIIIYRQKDVHV